MIQDIFELYPYTDNDIKNAFGKSLRQLREYKKLTQKELSQKVNIPTQSLSVYERGETCPTIIQAIRITAYFNLTIDDFILYGLGIQKIIRNDDEFELITTKYDFENQ